MRKKQPFVMRTALALFMVLCSVWGWGQETIAGWTFPNAPSTTVIVAECGEYQTSANIYLDGTNGSSTFTGITGFAGHAPAAANQVCGVNSNTQALAIEGTTNNNKGIVFKFPTTGYEDLKLSYSTRGTAAGYNTHIWSYSTDGSTFTTIDTKTGRNSTSFTTQTVDFSSVSTLDNQSFVYVKVIVSGATGNPGGNNRFDNIKFVGTALATCTTPAYDFDLTTVNKTLADAPFTNMYLSDNTSAEVYSSTNTAVATVDANTGEVTIVGEGTTTIEVTQAADATYCAVNAGYTLNVTCVPASYDFDLMVVNKDVSDAPFTNMFISDNTSPTVYSSSDTNVATVNAATGEVTLVGTGTATITVNQVADATHCAVTAGYTLNVTSSAPSLSVSGTADNGASCLNTATSVQTYTITNAGNSAAAGLTVVSDNAQFVVSNLSATTVAGSNGTVTFDVTFTPTSAGIQNATITVESTTSGSNTATFDVTGTGTAAADPVLSANAATAVTDIGATLNGDITSLGTCLTNPITEKGFVYGTSPDPVLNGGNFIAHLDPASTGAYNVAVTLSPATQYYYKAYVVDGTGQYYFSANEETFTTTLDVPVATAATNVLHNGFTANWNAVTGADGYILEVSEVTGAPMTDLIISEYVEGSGSNKAIEIYNGTSASVDLSNYTIIQFNNGASRTTGTRYALPLSGNLASGATYVIVNQSALQSIKDIADLVTNNSVLNFNGDDALAIYNSSDVTGTSISTSATEIDIFGVIGDDPGSAWTGAGGYTTVDKTLRRKATVSGGVTLNPSGTGANAFTTLTAEWDLFNIDTVDDLGSHTANTVIQTLLSTQNVGNVLTFDITGLDPNSNYTYTVKAVKGTVISADSNTISVTTGAAPASTTYTGGSWTNGAPNSPNTDAVISENYAGAGFIAKDITVNSGVSLTVMATETITANNVTVEDNANLIQQDGSTLNLSGTFTLNKNTTSAADKYVFWSAPVAGQNVYSIYPAGTPQFVMTYDSNTDLYPQVPDPTTAAPGVGYSVKVPSGATAAAFTGTPNNGIITVNVDNISTDNVNDNTWNLIGNPYPSNLNLQSLYSAGMNGIDSSIYFWDNITATNTTQQQAATTWAVFNAANGTWSATGAAGLGIDGNNNLVKPGQGFIVRATAPSITFTNAMRTAAAANFINKGMNPGEGKFWLKLTTPEGTQFQTAITYGGGALNTLEAFDSKVMSVGANGIYSYLGTDKLAIQGRDYFVNTDVVIIGNKHSASGQYTFSLAGKTGLFDAGQAIYLKDKQTNMYTNLQTDSYTFTADALEQQDRFEIVYQPQAALGTSETVKTETVVYKDGEHFTVKASEKILSIAVYDAAGRHIGTVKPNGTTAQVTVGSKGMYLLKITTVNAETVKKVIK